MTIEEKAKAYDEALKRAREWYNNSNSSSIGKSYLYAIFPELKESGNEDEKIRKEIINYFKCQSREEPSRKDTHNKWIAWLKKVIIPSHNDNDSSFIEDIKNVIDEAPLLMQSDKEKMIAWVEKQGELVDINPSEFDLRLNKLLKQFEGLSKEELANSLSFYLNVVQNDGTYNPAAKQGEQKANYATLVETGNGGTHLITNSNIK